MRFDTIKIICKYYELVYLEIFISKKEQIEFYPIRTLLISIILHITALCCASLLF